MPRSPKVVIRPNKKGKRRGYWNDVRVIDFDDKPTQTGEEAARLWLESPFDPRVKIAVEPLSPLQQEEPVKINCDDIVKCGMQGDPRFLAIWQKIQKLYSNPEFGRKVCLHEAAHAHFMEKNGVPHVTFHGPIITYNPITDEFEPEGAFVDGGITPHVQTTEKSILEYAKEATAGGVAVTKFMPVEKAGDNLDFQRFLATFYAIATPEVLQLNPEKIWKDAQDGVNAELDDEQVKAKVFARAEEYFRLLYQM